MLISSHLDFDPVEAETLSSAIQIPQHNTSRQLTNRQQNKVKHLYSPEINIAESNFEVGSTNSQVLRSVIGTPHYSTKPPFRHKHQDKVKHLSLLDAVLALSTSTTCVCSCCHCIESGLPLPSSRSRSEASTSASALHLQQKLPQPSSKSAREVDVEHTNTDMSSPSTFPFNQNQPHHTESLETCIRHRHSIRYFKPDPIPPSTLHSCLALAQLAPSNSNIQNWRITFARSSARDRIVEALYTAAQGPDDPLIPDLPEKYKHFRSELGHALYGKDGYGISRENKEELKRARMRNFRFFDAPVVGVITMDKELPKSDAMSVGLFVQTFMLALTEQNLGACLQVAVTGYPDVLRREFGISEDQDILCGIAVGYPAEHNKVNELVMTREDVWNGVTVLEE